MSPEGYNGIWMKVVALQRHAHGESFWQEVESVLNNVLQELFLDASTCDTETTSPFQYSIALDDRLLVVFTRYSLFTVQLNAAMAFRYLHHLLRRD